MSARAPSLLLSPGYNRPLLLRGCALQKAKVQALGILRGQNQSRGLRRLRVAKNGPIGPMRNWKDKMRNRVRAQGRRCAKVLGLEGRGLFAGTEKWPWWTCCREWVVRGRGGWEGLILPLNLCGDT